ncbi:nucleotidyltransferase domain-containing protein [Candidatus Pacearchaeota archaeon CG10_big_fil_rev_8_21_14_0_10_32_14]|nr:MAG: nucleotidyltransferase domain-containing protein [Candidatus Pacearchaeota archaeon CG10_big_fil_rev_8_21_14_0_10_32_14]
MDKKELIKEFFEKIKDSADYNKIQFIILFGSYSQNKQTKFSDIDIAIYFKGNKKERFDFRLKLLTGLKDKYDVHIFQDLPLPLRISVLKGELIYFKDMDFVYETAYQTIRAYDDIKGYYLEYINLKKNLS